MNRHSTRPTAQKPHFSRQLSVLYEDDAVIVLDKPPGLLSVPIAGSRAPSALSLLSQKLEWKKQRPFIVHRIDRFASGALLFAKNGRDRDPLVKQFLAHTPIRQYLAVVRGQIAPRPDVVAHYFKRDGMVQQLRTARDPKAARAEMRYSVERVFADATLVRVELLTGLQNQIRAQFAALGHPIVGDRKYHPPEAFEKRISRVALHAAHLEFLHPRTAARIAVDCNPPSDFLGLIESLSRTRHRAAPTASTPAPKVGRTKAKRNFRKRPQR